MITGDKVELSEDVHIHTVSAFSLKAYLKKGQEKSLVSESGKQSRLFEFIFKTTKSFPFNIFLAEANIFYILKAYRKACALIEEHGITTIYSSYIPYGDHYIAYLLKRKYPHLKWIADFRDLYVEPLYNDVWLPKWQKRIERKILAKADLVTTVSEGLKKHLVSMNRPVLSIKRGITPRPPKAQFPKFTISYTGSLFQEYRDPRPLFSTMRGLIDEGDVCSEDIELIYVGKDGALYTRWAEECGVGSLITNHGLVSRNMAYDIQDRSHINLLLTSSTSEWQGVLTGKVFEYFASGNATLCLIKGVRDPEIEALFQEFNAGVVAYDPELHENTLKAYVLSLYKEWKEHGKVQRKVNTSMLKLGHSWEARAWEMLRNTSTN